ncbi:MAG: hypothetical protein ACK5LR_10935 [Mangrovibacterium sp.]
MKKIIQPHTDLPTYFGYLDPQVLEQHAYSPIAADGFQQDTSYG